MGQENSVTVFRFCVRDSIEEQLYAEIGKAAKKLEKSKTNQLKTAEALMNQVPYAQK